MSLYQVKGSGIWYVSITHNGQRVRHSTGTSDRRAEQEYHDKLKADLWRAAALGERKKVEHIWGYAGLMCLTLRRKWLPKCGIRERRGLVSLAAVM